MNKKDFEKFVGGQLAGKSLEKQIAELEKVQTKYIPELINKRKKKLGTWVETDKKDKYLLCRKCHKYTLLKKCKGELVEEIREEYTYRDAAYGDDDMLGDVKYTVNYITCPHCGNRQEHKKFRIEVLREWNAKYGRR